MSTTRTALSAAWLINSKRVNNVPAGWDWTWCANEECPQIVWYDPGAKAAARGIKFGAVCSAQCALLAVKTLDTRK